jgi:hypothetical protein
MGDGEACVLQHLPEVGSELGVVFDEEDAW